MTANRTHSRFRHSCRETARTGHEPNRRDARVGLVGHSWNGSRSLSQLTFHSHSVVPFLFISGQSLSSSNSKQRVPSSRNRKLNGLDASQLVAGLHGGEQLTQPIPAARASII
jgi:hypothetical protein